MATQNRKEPLRAPRQTRSRERVAQIVKAAESLIEQKGCAGLKMGEIGKTAGINVASIYQYFPDKSAIVRALAQRYLDAFRLKVEAAFDVRPNDLDELAARTNRLLEDYYQLHRQNPVVQDIWTGSASDKAFRDVDTNDTQRNVELIFDRSKHLFPAGSHEHAQRALFLIVGFGTVAIASAVELDEDAGRQLMDEALIMLNACWTATLESLGIQPKS